MFDRFSRLVKANVNEILNKAEDPEKMLNQIVEDMQACPPGKTFEPESPRTRDRLR